MTRSARKGEKKAARAKLSRAKVADRRERLRAARAAATAPDPRRNLHVERGRPVVVNDITPYARPKCGECRGRGIVGMRHAGETTGAEPCRCATARFYKAHPEVIVTEAGEAFWPAEDVVIVFHQRDPAAFIMRKVDETRCGSTDGGILTSDNKKVTCPKCLAAIEDPTGARTAGEEAARQGGAGR